MKSINQLIQLICLFMFCLQSINAQIEIPGTEFMLNKLRLNKGLKGIPNTLYQDIQGDPFIFRDFQEGKLYVAPDQKVDVNVRYDIYADQMHLKDSSNMIYAIIHPEKVKLIEAGNYKFLYSFYLNSPKDDEPAQSSYFIVKTGKKCLLLVKKNIRIQDAELPTLYHETTKPAKFILTADTYFLKNEGSNAVRIRNKKDLLTVLADKSDAVSSYISSNKLDVKDAEDLIKIVSYYNSL